MTGLARLFLILLVAIGVQATACTEQEPLGPGTELPDPDPERPLDPGLSFDFACLRSGPIENPLRSASRPLSGIPALIDPEFLPAEDVDYLVDEDLVFGVEIQGRFLAFPAKILNYHEVVTFSVDSYRYAATW